MDYTCDYCDSSNVKQEQRDVIICDACVDWLFRTIVQAWRSGLL